jgi:hypothetical protein
MALEMNDIRSKLTNLKQYMTGEPDIIYEFGRFLAERLNPRLTPEGFNLALELAMHDIQTGTGYTGKPITHALTGYPQIVYASLGTRLNDIAKTVLPEEFYKKFEDVRKKMEDQISKKTSS